MPTSRPSSQPTYRTDDYQMRGDWSDYQRAVEEMTGDEEDTSVLFSNYFYKGLVPEGDCEDWTSFAKSSTNLPLKVSDSPLFYHDTPLILTLTLTITVTLRPLPHYQLCPSRACTFLSLRSTCDG